MTQITNNNLQVHFQKLFHAKNELLVCSPFISSKYLADLINVSKKNVKVKVVTDPRNNQFIRSALEIHKKNEKTHNFEFKILERLHAKIYISDNDFAIHGSANLTESGLKLNIEQISIVEEKNTINQLKKVFDDIWKKEPEKIPEKEKAEKYTFKELRKKNPRAYESWTESDDEFLKKFWNDKSNQQSWNEKIQELMKKLGRNKGSIRSRLKKKGLD